MRTQGRSSEIFAGATTPGWRSILPTMGRSGSSTSTRLIKPRQITGQPQIAGFHVPSLRFLPVTANDLTALQQGVQAFTDPGNATSVATAIDAVPAGQTVA